MTGIFVNLGALEVRPVRSGSLVVDLNFDGTFLRDVLSERERASLPLLSSREDNANPLRAVSRCKDVAKDNPNVNYCKSILSSKRNEFIMSTS